MGSHLSKLLSKDIKAFGKNNNNDNNRKLKAIGNITVIIGHNPRNGYRWGKPILNPYVMLNQVMNNLLLGFRIALEFK